MQRIRRLVAVPAALALAALLTTACEVPPPVLTVNTTADGLDANPGDGICETAAGTGTCTLRAAVAEGNALGAADLTVPAGDYQLSVLDAADGNRDLDVTGRLELNWEAPVAVTVDAGFDVAASGSLVLDGVGVTGLTKVAGHLFANRSFLSFTFGGSPGPNAPLEIAPGGDALVVNSDLFGWSLRGVVYNEGTVRIVFTTVHGIPFSTTPMLTTTAGASSNIAATRFTATASFHGQIINDYSGMPACSGPVVSQGYNTTLNSSCALDQPGDTESGALSAWVDRVPTGVLGCGSAVIADRAGTPRPSDGNGDSIAACDTGGFEKPAA